MSRHVYSFGYPEHLARYKDIAKESAERILPFVHRLLQFESFLDVGCGTGTWLSIAQHHGVPVLFGVDGPWLDMEDFELDESQFRAVDLTRPLDLGRRFDLVCCLEVASDIPAEFEVVLMESLVRHGDAILFSSATMTQHHRPHVNKRWQSYWVEMFANRGFLAFDVIRPHMWTDETIGAHYRQNCILFACGEAAMKIRKAVREYELTPSFPLDVVHPAIASRPIGGYSLWALLAIAATMFWRRLSGGFIG